MCTLAPGGSCLILNETKSWFYNENASLPYLLYDFPVVDMIILGKDSDSI